MQKRSALLKKRRNHNVGLHFVGLCWFLCFLEVTHQLKACKRKRGVGTAHCGGTRAAEQCQGGTAHCSEGLEPHWSGTDAQQWRKGWTSKIDVSPQTICQEEAYLGMHQWQGRTEVNMVKLHQKSDNDMYNLVWMKKNPEYWPELHTLTVKQNRMGATKQIIDFNLMWNACLLLECSVKPAEPQTLWWCVPWNRLSRGTIRQCATMIESILHWWQGHFGSSVGTWNHLKHVSKQQNWWVSVIEIAFSAGTGCIKDTWIVKACTCERPVSVLLRWWWISQNWEMYVGKWCDGPTYFVGHQGWVLTFFT